MKHPHLFLKTLHKTLHESSEYEDEKGVSTNPSTHSHQLESLFEKHSQYFDDMPFLQVRKSHQILKNIAGNVNTPPHILRTLLYDKMPQYEDDVFNNPVFDMLTLEDPSLFTDYANNFNPHQIADLHVMHPKVLNHFIEQGHHPAMDYVVDNEPHNYSPSNYYNLFKSIKPKHYRYQDLLKRPELQLTHQDKNRLFNSDDPAIIAALLSRHDTPVHVLHGFAKQNDPKLNLSIIYNNNTSPETLRLLSNSTHSKTKKLATDLLNKITEANG